MARSAALTRAVRRVGRQLSTPTGAVQTRTGTVKTVTAGASLDGVAQVVVTVDGNDVIAPYAKSYTPTVNDFVLVLLVDGSPFIYDAIVGLPNI